MIKEITDQVNCTTCSFCRTFRSEQIIGKVEYKCMRMPPGVIAVPVGMNSHGLQVSVQSTFPPVHPQMICGEWKRPLSPCPVCHQSGQEKGVDYIGCAKCGGSGLVS